mgnify:CR=1 FL=1
MLVSWEAVAVISGVMSLIATGSAFFVRGMIKQSALETRLDITTIKGEILARMADGYVGTDHFAAAIKSLEQQIHKLRSPELTDHLQRLIDILEVQARK